MLYSRGSLPNSRGRLDYADASAPSHPAGNCNSSGGGSRLRSQDREARRSCISGHGLSAFRVGGGIFNRATFAPRLGKVLMVYGQAWDVAERIILGRELDRVLVQVSHILATFRERRGRYFCAGRLVVI